MAELTKKERSEAAKKAAKTRAENKERGDKPEILDDLHTQADDMASMGQFVEVTKGPHKGRYGVVIEDAAGENVVIRTRDESSDRLLVPYEALRPAEAGKR
jgi:hypothetical protein